MRVTDTTMPSLNALSVDDASTMNMTSANRDYDKKDRTLYHSRLRALRKAQAQLLEYSYCIELYVFVAECYASLAYPDLAAGAAYKALLLSDAIDDESDEYHEQAVESLNWSVTIDGDDLVTLRETSERSSGYNLRLKIYQILIQSLVDCGCLQTAHQYYSQLYSLSPDERLCSSLLDTINNAVALYFCMKPDNIAGSKYNLPSNWPDQGFVRRECYPWNDREPDRLQSLDTINSMLHEAAPKLEVRVVELPALSAPDDSETTGISRQLGVFATEDIAPGEIVLDETSMLTANNRLQDALCDGCSADLPELSSAAASETVTCPECEVVYCSADCHDRAAEEYHPALCGMDVEAIAKDVPAKDAADSLYSLLLLRALAMAETQQCHPLDVPDVKYIWADFHSIEPEQHWQPPSELDTPGSSTVPKTLPFSFEQNVRLPLHMLEKMDIDIFANQQHDTWVFNTLFAKFRGTASARLSGRAGTTARGPEVGAVHFLWCLANHSCDPNVSWEWGGSIKFEVRKERVKWRGPDGTFLRMNSPGLGKGEEVLNHYCDVDLPVDERRAWARGALGGDCRCERCCWEAGETENRR